MIWLRYGLESLGVLVLVYLAARLFDVAYLTSYGVRFFDSVAIYRILSRPQRPPPEDDPWNSTRPLPNGGTVAAVIAVVIIFLKKQNEYEARTVETREKYEARIDKIVDRCLADLAAARKDYLDRIGRLMGDHDRHDGEKDGEGR